MKRKHFYVIDIPDSRYQVLVFRSKNFGKDGIRLDDTYDFYLCDEEMLSYQFGIPCKNIHVSEFEHLAISNFSVGNMCF